MFSRNFRRGLAVAALRSFMYSQGASRRVVNMVWHTFWAENKKEIDKSARRFMAIDSEKNCLLRVTGGPVESDHAYVETSLHPKDPNLGTRLVRISSEVYLEAVDTDGIEGEFVTLHQTFAMKSY